MTRTILVTGTASHVGKSTIVAGLCRLLADLGVDVAPFKAQNMSNNARAVVSPDGDDGEIGVSQYVQARAARVPPTTDMNPVLLKPRGDGESQLIVHGEAVGHFDTEDYYDTHWTDAREAAATAYDRLAAAHDVVVAEGAGSVAEINLHDRDLSNVETARFADATLVLVVDIERGGAFASLYGTLELMPTDLRPRVVGSIINKFRGDRTLLEPGISEIESRTNVPILGVLPYDDPGLPSEDSLSLPPRDELAVVGRDAEPSDRIIRIAVPRFPRMSNFTDLEPLAHEQGVRIEYVPPNGDLLDADAVVLPGTKNTVDDLLALREGGLADQIAAFDGPIVGLCGGYQILGRRIRNAGIESTRLDGVVEGLGLLPVETVFQTEKRVTRVTRQLDGVGPLAGGSGPVTGYEIHMGRTEPMGDVTRPVGAESAAKGRVLGTYLHGLFENENAREAFIETVYDTTGSVRPRSTQSQVSSYDRAATLVETHLDLDPLELPIDESRP